MRSGGRRVLIVGAGVAGSRLAWRLAGSGHEALLLDYRAPWEKPCGGGLTPKVVHDFPELRKLYEQARRHYRIHMVFPAGRRVRMTLLEPIITLSRERLGSFLHERAMESGAVFHKEKVLSITKNQEGWTAVTDAGQYRADFLVGAEGVNGVVRRSVVNPLPRQDLCVTFGTLLPVEVQMPIVIRFFKGFHGYAWIFPRMGETSVGIALENGDAKRDRMVADLKRFVKEEFEQAGLEAPEVGRPWAWLLPSMRHESFMNNPVSGEGWALVGDSSGSADPVTGEGIYYALKTADLLHDTIESGDLGRYPLAWREMARLTVGKVSKVRDLFYRTPTLRALGFVLDYSPKARKVARDLLNGELGYDMLRQRVYDEWKRYLFELALNGATRNRGERRKKKKRKSSSVEGS